MIIEYNGNLVGNNKRYAYRGKKILSEEYKAFKDSLGWLFKANKPILDDTNLFSVIIEYNSRHDIDALLKAILDSAEGIVYSNDKQVDNLYVRKNKELDCKLRVEINTSNAQTFPG